MRGFSKWIAGLALAPSLAMAADVTGVVTAVHDGASFVIDGQTEVKVFGIDAPDLAQRCRADAIYEPGPAPCVPCGEHARRALASLLEGKRVTCKDRGRSGAAITGECTQGKILVGPWMLSQGWAVVFEPPLERGERPVYFGAQNSAKRASAGLWSTTFIPPAAWRDQKQRLACEK